MFQEWCGYAADRLQDEQMQAEETDELTVYVLKRSEQDQVQQKWRQQQHAQQQFQQQEEAEAATGH